jgi:tetratricopeptide (TPR) repeat protein
MLHALKLLRAGRRDEAAQACRARLDEAPEDVDALQLLGVIAGMGGDYESARQWLTRADALRPRHPDILDNLARACRECGDPAAAKACSETAIAVAPTRAASWYGLALAERRLGDRQAALRCYHRVVELDPSHADGWANLAQLAESLSLLEEADEAATRALALAPDNGVAALAAAQVALRRDDPAGARDRLERLLAQPTLAPNNQAIAHQRLGVALDRLDEPGRAFAEFEAGNRILAQAHQAAFRQGEGPLSLPAVRRLHDYVRQLDPASWRPPTPADGYPAPIFLLGFPRSGTTLTDRMLDAHPALATLEERDTLIDLQRDFVLAPDGLPRLGALDPSVQRAYRDAYRRRVADWIDPLPGVGLVDKLPLHSISLPLINAVFPDARVIFVVRDPRDVCLSCFMQSFELNEAMRHFLDLELTAEYYCEVMGLALSALERLPVHALTLRYEDLVQDTEGVCRSLLNFLDVAWDPVVLSWHQSQAGRQIDTPSYRQVSRPIYRSAVGRWRRYETELAPILERLAVYAHKLGYD